MTMLKTIDGHSSVRALKRYLERNGRAAATLCLNLGDEREWAADMDATRRAHGHDRKRGGRGRTRFYEHFVVSPNPKDEAALDKDRVRGGLGRCSPTTRSLSCCTTMRPVRDTMPTSWLTAPTLRRA